jgi:hypothetical protein
MALAVIMGSVTSGNRSIHLQNPDALAATGSAAPAPSSTTNVPITANILFINNGCPEMGRVNTFAFVGPSPISPRGVRCVPIGCIARPKTRCDIYANSKRIAPASSHGVS